MKELDKTIEKMKEETRETMKRCCYARMGELLAEIYRDYNVGETIYPYKLVMDYKLCLDVELPNMQWSDTTFTLPVDEFCNRMFNRGNVDVYALGMCTAFTLQMREYGMIGDEVELGCLFVALDIERKCGIEW